MGLVVACGAALAASRSLFFPLSLSLSFSLSLSPSLSLSLLVCLSLSLSHTNAHNRQREGRQRDCPRLRVLEGRRIQGVERGVREGASGAGQKEDTARWW